MNDNLALDWYDRIGLDLAGCMDDTKVQGRASRRRIGNIATTVENRMNFRVELIYSDGSDDQGGSIYLTGDGRVLLQGPQLSDDERKALGLPEGTGLISIDRRTIQAIKEML